MKLPIATFFWTVATLALVSLSGCGAPDLDTRREIAAATAPPGYEPQVISTQLFDIFSYAPQVTSTHEQLTVLIEGDGYPWISKRRRSDDPTPFTHNVLSLLSSGSNGNKAYLARPCQFVGPTSRNCDPKFWTQERYSEPVVTALNEAISFLKSENGAQSLVLVGYSGGGTLAALLAARRSDVSAFITYAAPLDITAFTEHHNVSPMTGSLNPVDVVAALSNIPQIHLFGNNDEIVPSSLAQNYLHALNHRRCVKIAMVNADHWTGWTDLSPPPSDITPACKANQQ